MLRSRIFLISILFTFALVLRLGVAIWLGLGDAPLSGSDAEEYDRYAWNLAQGRGYRGMSPDVSDQDHLTAYRTPGTSLLWGALYSIFGHRYEVVRVVNCFLGALSSVLLLQLGRLSFGERIGWGAAIVWAGFPTSLFFSAQLGSEPLMLVMLLGFLVASLHFAHSPTWLGAVFAGFLLGMTLLVHPSKAIMLPLVFVWVIWQFRKQATKLLLGFAIPVVAVAVLSPWVIRNYYVFGEFIPFSTMGGSALLQGNNRLVVTNPTLHGYVIWDTKIPEYAELLQKPNNEIERDKVARTLAFEWLKENRDKWPFLIVAKLQRGLTPFLQPGAPKLEAYGMLLSWGPVLVLSAVAFPVTLIAFLRKGDPSWLIHLAILHFLAVTVIFFGYARYRYSIEPLGVLLAFKTLGFMFSRFFVTQEKLSR
ncbi:MAG TPA: glycosyltransferase family 39 protein [Bacteroidota bacterium]